MRKSFFFILSLFFIGFYSCDDGDVITFELDFEDTFEACEGVNNLVFYKTKDDPSESLSVLISGYSLNEILDVGDDNTFSDTKPATLFYRTYSDNDLPNNLFCSDVSPNVTIVNDEEDEVTAIINTILEEDDNDGVPADLEVEGDTDGDGLPNYIDMDDDGDNVLTKDENPDPNGDGDLSDAQDTDNDGIPDYLDDDDDGDGTLTRDEEKGTQDQNLGNDITNSNVGPDYLNPDVDDRLPAIAYRAHSITQTYTVILQITDLSLTLLSQESLEFGILSDSILSNSRTITPDFN